jgi:hypothetical protein
MKKVRAIVSPGFRLKKEEKKNSEASVEEVGERRVEVGDWRKGSVWSGADQRLIRPLMS